MQSKRRIYDKKLLKYKAGDVVKIKYDSGFFYASTPSIMKERENKVSIILDIYEKSEYSFGMIEEQPYYVYKVLAGTEIVENYECELEEI